MVLGFSPMHQEEEEENFHPRGRNSVEKKKIQWALELAVFYKFLQLGSLWVEFTKRQIVIIQ